MGKAHGGAAVRHAAKRVDESPQKIRAVQTPLVSKKMLAKVGRISKDRNKAIAFLKKGGFLDADGKLSLKYRPAK